MSCTVSLEISDELYRALSDVAARQDRSAEEVGAQWLEVAAQSSQSNGAFADDPIENIIGSVNSGGLDWADRSLD